MNAVACRSRPRAAGLAARAEPHEPPAWFRRKRVPIRILAGLLLVAAAPLIAVLLLLVRLTSPGPAIYRQVRMGRGGRLFTIYKIRTMRLDAEADTGPVWAARRDPRVTPVGRVLRWTHLDELPQLVNIVRGEMCLLGPRPERPEIAVELARYLPDYAERLAVLPGVTGLAQVRLPADEDLEGVRRKLQVDREYIERASLRLDLRILLCTALKVCGVPRAWALRLCRLAPTQREPTGSLPTFAGRRAA
jgi:lipopolysaccharide/colanic/teichoic acid biosynthesis glycosyltransferase